MKPNGIVHFAQALASICHSAASPPPWINGGAATICGWTEMKVQPAVSDMASASAASVLVNRGLLRRTDGAAQTQGRRCAMGTVEHQHGPIDAKAQRDLGPSRRQLARERTGQAPERSHWTSSCS